MAGDNNTAKDAMSTHEPGAPEGLYSVVARAGRPTLHQVGRPRARPDHIRGLQRGSNRTSGKPEAQQLQSHGLSKWLKITPSQNLRTSTNFFYLRVFIKEEPQQEGRETLRSNDTKIAAIKLPRCP